MNKIKMDELKKMSHRSVLITFILAVLLSSAAILFSIQDESWIDKTGKTLVGLAAIHQKTKDVSSIEGYVIEENIKDYVETYKNIYNKNKMKDDIIYAQSIQPFSDISSLMFSIYENDNSSYCIENELSDKNIKDFYLNWKKDVSKKLNTTRYTEKQKNIIQNKINQIKTPFTYEFYDGWEFFITQFRDLYMLILFVIAVALSTIFSKDHPSGIDELILSTKAGRKIIGKEKYKAGIIFSVGIYILFIGLFAIAFHFVYSFKGKDTSIQFFYRRCIYSISVGQVSIILLLLGFIGVIFMGELVMYLSVKLKKSKTTLLLSMLIIILPYLFADTTNKILVPFICLFPINLVYSDKLFCIFPKYHFGDRPFSYIWITLVIMIPTYIMIKKSIMKSMKNYKLIEKN